MALGNGKLSLTNIGAVLGILGALILGTWNFQARMDGRYALASETKEQIGGLRALYVQQARAFQKSELRALQKEQFELRAIQPFRKLTSIELFRLQQVEGQVADIQKELTRY